MSGLKRPSEPSGGPSSLGAPPEKRRDREGGEDVVQGVSATAGGSTAVETVIKLGGVSNLVRMTPIELKIVPVSFFPELHKMLTLHDCFFVHRRSRMLKLSRLRTGSWENPSIKDRYGP